MKNAVISIWEKTKTIEQGKYMEQDGHRYFVFNMKYRTDKTGEKVINKWLRMGNGYTIAKQVFDALSKLPSKPSVRIIATLKEANCYFETTLAKYKSNGWIPPVGGHRQLVLNRTFWETKKGKFPELKNLPEMTIAQWEKASQKVEIYEGGEWVTV